MEDHFVKRLEGYCLCFSIPWLATTKAQGSKQQPARIISYCDGSRSREVPDPSRYQPRRCDPPTFAPLLVPAGKKFFLPNVSNSNLYHCIFDGVSRDTRFTIPLVRLLSTRRYARYTKVQY